MNTHWSTVKTISLFILIGIITTACTNDDDQQLISTDNDSAYENGMLILHEGNFSAGNATVSFVAKELDSSSNRIFETVNNAPLGDTAQSIGFKDNLAFIVVNNSQKIEVVNRYTFIAVATIDTGLLNPRYIAFANGKGYVTNWGDGTDATDDFVAVIDLETYTVATTVSVPEGPEGILAHNNTLYIAHQGGFGTNNMVSVLDAATNNLGTAISVADRPNAMQLVGDYLWVLSGGNPAWTDNETRGQLDKIDIATHTVASSFPFKQTEHPRFLSVDGDVLYYVNNAEIFAFDTAATTLPSTSQIAEVAFYNMTVNNGKLYGVNAKDFASNGTLEVYDLSTTTLEETIEVGIIPNGIYFNDSFEN